MFETSHFHPMIVHFPIALLLAGILADLASLIYKNEPCLKKAGFYLQISGTLGAIAAFLTGFLFTPELAGPVREIRETHELFAQITMWVMIVSSIVRIYLVVKKMEETNWKWLSLILFLIGATAVGITGYLGGNMVYIYLIGG
jgi:uncharacterized membrane protein